MSEKIEALLFGADYPKAGLPVQIAANESSLHVFSLSKTIKYAQLNAQLGGFDHDQLQLHWQENEANFSLIPLNKTAQKSLIERIPAGAVQGMQGWKVATRSQSAVWNSVIYGIGLLAILSVLVVWQYDRVVGWVANSVSIETENQMSEAILTSLEAEQKLIKTGAAVDFVQKIGGELTQGSRYQYRWFVTPDENINAFAAPGGIVIVNAGLLKAADNPNEVAAVLAHEVQHVEGRHALKNMISSAGIATVVMLVLGDANAAMLIIAHRLTAQVFGRHVESEADEKGLNLLIKKKIAPTGMASFFEKLQKKYPQQTEIPEWLSSHPDTQKRIDAAKKFALANPCKACRVLSWDKPAILASLADVNQAEPKKSTGD